jgi:hypothetical protein
MSSHALRGIARPETKEARKPGFFTGLVEGIGSYRRISEIERILTGVGDISEAVPAALDLFSTLDGKSKTRVLLNLSEALERHSSFPFQYEHSVRAVTMLGEFFSEAAKEFPVSQEAASVFLKIAKDSSLYEPGNPLHQAARLSCAKALSELDAGDKGFWKERLFDPATSDYALAKLLDEPEGGWSILKENLEKTALAIATSKSDKKAAFLAAMLRDDNPEILKISIAASIYLEAVPSDSITRIREISKMSEELSMWARIFEDACHFKSMLSYADDRQFYGAMNLIAMYRSGVNFLPPLLFQIGLEMMDIHQDPAGSSEEERAINRKKAEEILANLHVSGIRIPGVKIEFK